MGLGISRDKVIEYSFLTGVASGQVGVMSCNKKALAAAVALTALAAALLSTEKKPNVSSVNKK